jgi:hypothetical protein
MAAITYLRAPLKVENNHTNSKPNSLVWAGCSLALGILSYYAPKTFLATSVGIFAYQVYSFNQLVQTADPSNHQRIHTWAINACLVMWSVGFVFLTKSLPCFWFALKDIRHISLIDGVGHLAKGVILVLASGFLEHFNDSANDLASRRRWVEMEDYVANYPPEVKQNILSSYWKQIRFYISALIPQTKLATRFSAHNFCFSQFQPMGHKFSILQRYFGNIDLRQWSLAIHQFQQLPVENQITFGPQLSHRFAYFGHHLSDCYDAGLKVESHTLPDDVKAILLNNTLNSYERIPSYREAAHGQWEAFIKVFEQLPREQQSVLGQELIRLIRTKSLESIPDIFPEPMRLAALKVCIQTPVSFDLINAIFDGLTDPFKAEFGLFLQGLIENDGFDKNDFPPAMQAVLPH